MTFSREPRATTTNKQLGQQHLQNDGLCRGESSRRSAQTSTCHCQWGKWILVDSKLPWKLCKPLTIILEYHVIRTGLQQQYISDKGTNTHLRNIMSLEFLSEITLTFKILGQEASTAPLQLFLGCVADSWIYGNTWLPSSWGIFMMAVRKNNDIEGWHHALTRRAVARWQMPFYLLIELLHWKAKLSALQNRLVSEKKLKRIQWKNEISLQRMFLTTGRIIT